MAAARYLAEHGVAAAGTDTEDFEVAPSKHQYSALPVHLELLGQRGIHIMELLYLEQLATSAAGSFLFICLPLRIRGATGSMVRPIAII
jgi:kynurenine formamidase